MSYTPGLSQRRPLYEILGYLFGDWKKAGRTIVLSTADIRQSPEVADKAFCSYSIESAQSPGFLDQEVSIPAPVFLIDYLVGELRASVLLCRPDRLRRTA
jgi:hypothetical protein